MKIETNGTIHSTPGIFLRDIDAYPEEIYLSTDEVQQLYNFISDLKGSSGKEVSAEPQELETLKKIVEEQQKVITQLGQENTKNLETTINRLRAAHLYDLRIHVKVLDSLMNPIQTVSKDQ